MEERESAIFTSCIFSVAPEFNGSTENAGRENGVPAKFRGGKMQDVKMTDQIAGHEIAGHENKKTAIAGRENAGHEIGIAGHEYIRLTICIAVYYNRIFQETADTADCRDRTNILDLWQWLRTTFAPSSNCNY